MYPALPPDTDCHQLTVNGTFCSVSLTLLDSVDCYPILVKDLVLLNFRPAIYYS